MKKKRLILLSAASLLLGGCAQKQSPTETISFDPQEKTPLSEAGVIKDYEIYPLETTDSSKIGMIDKAVVTDSRIYVLDRFQAQAVFVFDKSGKYRGRIQRTGRGSDEYLQLFDISVDEKVGTVSLLSRMPSKIMTFSADGDSLLGTVPLERSYTGFAESDGSYFAFQGNYSQGDDHKNLCRLSESGEIMDKWFDIPEGWESGISAQINPISRGTDGKIHFISPYSYDIYEYSKDGFNKTAKLDFGEFNMPAAIKTFQDLHEDNSSGYISEIRNYTETPRHLVFHTIFQGQDLLLVHDKSTGKNSSHACEADDSKYWLPFGKIVSFDVDKIITSVEASSMDFYLTGKNAYNDFSEEYGEQIRRLNDRVGEVKDSDNPLLIIYSLN